MLSVGKKDTADGRDNRSTDVIIELHQNGYHIHFLGKGREIRKDEEYMTIVTDSKGLSTASYVHYASTV